MPDKPAAPPNVTLSDLTTTKLKSQFISDFSYDEYARLVNDDVKAKAASTKAARAAELARRRAR